MSIAPRPARGEGDAKADEGSNWRARTLSEWYGEAGEEVDTSAGESGEELELWQEDADSDDDPLQLQPDLGRARGLSLNDWYAASCSLTLGASLGDGAGRATIGGFDSPGDLEPAHGWRRRASKEPALAEADPQQSFDGQLELELPAAWLATEEDWQLADEEVRLQEQLAGLATKELEAEALVWEAEWVQAYLSEQKAVEWSKQGLWSAFGAYVEDTALDLDDMDFEDEGDGQDSEGEHKFEKDEDVDDEATDELGELKDFGSQASSSPATTSFFLLQGDFWSSLMSWDGSKTRGMF